MQSSKTLTNCILDREFSINSQECSRSKEDLYICDSICQRTTYGARSFSDSFAHIAEISRARSAREKVAWVEVMVRKTLEEKARYADTGL